MTKLCIPEKILDQHLVVLGKTGAGKSSALRHIVEHLLREKKRVCVIDPKGDWSGLKSSADGKSAGFPVIGFGDFKDPRGSDVPINAQSGRHVAELITSGNRPCMIGFRGWMTSHMVQFWIDFAAGIFNANSGELYLVIDEAHNFAPKGKIMDPQAGKCLHWTNRLMAEGRGLGIICLIASQRPQKVHNDTLTSCETLVAMRVIHKADRDAVQDWIEGCGDMAQGKEVLNSLASRRRGEAYVWSPEAKFGPELVTFPMFDTFDSFAPPQLQKQVSERGWAEVDLGAVKQKLAKVIEESKANDPNELRKEIARLKAEAKKSTSVAPAKVETKIKEIPMLSKDERKRLTKLIDAFDRLYATAEGHYNAVCDLSKATNELKPEVAFFKNKLTPPVQGVAIGLSNPWTPPSRPVIRQPRGVPRVESQNGDDWIPSRCARAILTVLAQFGPSNKRKVALVSGYSVRSGGFNNSLSELRSHGAMEGDSNQLQITPEGETALGQWEPLPTGDDLAEHWLRELGACESAILGYLLSIYPDAAGKEQIGEATKYAPSSGGFNNSLSRLRTFELIDDLPGRTIKASEILKDE